MARRTPLGDRLLAAFAPGPLTVVLPASGAVTAAVTAGLGTVAVRIPAHAAALRVHVHPEVIAKRRGSGTLFRGSG